MSAIIEHDEIHFYCLVVVVLNCSNIPEPFLLFFFSCSDCSYLEP